jgi:hypothetical protein
MREVAISWTKTPHNRLKYNFKRLCCDLIPGNTVSQNFVDRIIKAGITHLPAKYLKTIKLRRICIADICIALLKYVLARV